VVKFDEKTLAGERRIYPFVLLIGIILLLIGILWSGNPAALNSAVLVWAWGTAFFSAGVFWWVDRTFHLED
jgi:uncharacterized membrane protein HdeD (DUF308 family)